MDNAIERWQTSKESFDDRTNEDEVFSVTSENWIGTHDKYKYSLWACDYETTDMTDINDASIKNHEKTNFRP